MNALLDYMMQTGWTDPAELQDPEYDAYCKRVEDHLSYAGWLDMRARWDALHRKWLTHYKPMLDQNDNQPEHIMQEINDLMLAMVKIEVAQGY